MPEVAESMFEVITDIYILILRPSCLLNPAEETMGV